jgi:D-threonate/D-erythronate kinase
MPEILILADDLTGAADCAGGCAAAGLETLVLLAPDVPAEATPTVIAIDLDTREQPAREAGVMMTRALERVWDATIKVIYHKIDSTLRGPWAHAVAAAANSLGTAVGAPPLILVAPAFPARGRITRAGRVLVQAPSAGHESASPGAPVGDAGEIAAPLKERGLNVHCLDRAEFNAPGLAEQFGALARARVDAIVCDAETEQDLAALAAAGLASGLPLLWVGSAGLMRPLAAAFAPAGRLPATLPVVRGPLLFVIGSAAAVARAQFEALAAEAQIAALSLGAEDLTSPGGHLGAALEAALGRGTDTALMIEEARPGQMPLRLDPGWAARLADIAAPHLAGVGGLVATGGETARRLLNRAGICAIKLGGEVEVGVPWGIALGDRVGQVVIDPRASGAIGLHPSFPIITKAGAFGDAGTLVRCRKALKARER